MSSDWLTGGRLELVIGSPCCQLVADAAAVCDDLTETQLQVNLSLRRRERESSVTMVTPATRREGDTEREKAMKNDCRLP